MQTSAKDTIQNIAIAGLVGQFAFEAYAWLLSPALFGPALQPSNLVMAIAAKLTGAQIPYGAAFVLHFLIGSFGFAALVWLLKRVTGWSYILAGGVTGFALWFVAQGVLAPFIGRSFMMGFGSYTQSSFVSHVGMTLVMGAVLRTLENRQGSADQVSQLG
ncbi:hypothetical protein [Amaricoccus macauensis]|uniref:hypothetical protein n=1 Tax=Amaricoccus macauensis TaxID=57001 RepID=UPI003C79D31D